jgi:hypothetical protein
MKKKKVKNNKKVVAAEKKLKYRLKLQMWNNLQRTMKGKKMQNSNINFEVIIIIIITAYLFVIFSSSISPYENEYRRLDYEKTLQANY